jgi:hypothetical protein
MALALVPSRAILPGCRGLPLATAPTVSLTLIRRTSGRQVLTPFTIAVMAPSRKDRSAADKSAPARDARTAGAGPLVIRSSV